MYNRRVQSWTNLYKSSKNIVADALSQLEKTDNLNYKIEPNLNSLSENFALENKDILHPTSFKTIMRLQQQDNSLIEIAQNHSNDYSIKQFHGADKTYSLICRNPKQMQKSLVEWY